MENHLDASNIYDYDEGADRAVLGRNWGLRQSWFIQHYIAFGFNMIVVEKFLSMTYNTATFKGFTTHKGVFFAYYKIVSIHLTVII